MIVKNRNYLFLLLAFFSGVLLCLPWLVKSTGIMLLIGFVPLLYVENKVFGMKNEIPAIAVFYYSNITFFVWNVLATWWIGKATLLGLTAAVLINTLLMSLVFYAFHLASKYIKDYRYILLIAFWVTFEYLYHKSEISWPWLTLGNGLANNIKLIQWYEFTGVLGGSLWVLLVNILLFRIPQFINISVISRPLVLNGITLLLMVFIPVIISIYMFNNYSEKGKKYQITLFQPGVNPYLSDSELEISKQDVLLKMLENNISDSSKIVLGPEVYILKSINENKYFRSSIFNFYNKIFKAIDSTDFIIGVNSYKLFKEKDNKPVTAKKFKNTHLYSDRYNSLMHLNKSNVNFRHKSRLVLGVEKLPYQGKLKFLEKLSDKFGGVAQGKGVDKVAKVFTLSNDSLKIAPLVCYESVYGDYVAEFIRNGAMVILLSTNDGWWGNTAGYNQHMSYSRLRAIETRRSVARSANTGISCFINQKGEVLDSLGYMNRNLLSGSVTSNSKLTFYVKNGNYIGEFFLKFSVGVILFILIFLSIKKFGFIKI